MTRITLISIALIAFPTIVSLFGGWLMLEVSGRERLEAPAAKEIKPLQQRPFGYTDAEAQTYWNALGPAGQHAELRLLKMDLLFVLLYGGAIAFATVMAWTLLETRFSAFWFLIPIFIVMVADWSETSLHLNQLGRFADGGALDAGTIRLASSFTIAKLWLICVSAVVVIAMVAVVFVNGVRSSAPAVS